MISQELKDQFRKEIDTFEESALAFEAGELDRAAISGGFGICAERFPLLAADSWRLRASDFSRLQVADKWLTRSL